MPDRIYLKIPDEHADRLRAAEPEIVEWIKETTGAEMPLCVRWDTYISAKFTTETAALLFKMRWL